MNESFAKSRYDRLFSPLFVFVGLVECCILENFGSPWCVTTTDFQSFGKKQTKLLTIQGGC
jgi:hypothetical protein